MNRSRWVTATLFLGLLPGCGEDAVAPADLLTALQEIHTPGGEAPAFFVEDRLLEPDAVPDRGTSYRTFELDAETKIELSEVGYSLCQVVSGIVCPEAVPPVVMLMMTDVRDDLFWLVKVELDNGYSLQGYLVHLSEDGSVAGIEPSFSEN